MKKQGKKRKESRGAKYILVQSASWRHINFTVFVKNNLLLILMILVFFSDAFSPSVHMIWSCLIEMNFASAPWERIADSDIKRCKFQLDWDSELTCPQGSIWSRKLEAGSSNWKLWWCSAVTVTLEGNRLEGWPLTNVAGLLRSALGVIRESHPLSSWIWNAKLSMVMVN